MAWFLGLTAAPLQAQQKPEIARVSVSSRARRAGDAPDTWAMASRVADPIVASAPAPFGLDVWRGGGVVLSIGWVPDGPVEVVALQHGVWEDEALALG